jgi:hypothetical protein
MAGYCDIVIDRFIPCSQSIIGKLYVNGNFVCYTLELAWLWNANDISCIPPGHYTGMVRHDKKDGWRIQLVEVPGPRTGVQIHIGNYPRDVHGCILVGTNYGNDVVLHSAKAYELLKAAFDASKGKNIRLKFQGILATPWGDYPGSVTNVA